MNVGITAPTIEQPEQELDIDDMYELVPKGHVPLFGDYFFDQNGQDTDLNQACKMINGK